MGHRPPPFPPEYGLDCPTFPAGKTPRQIVVFFSGIDYCEDIWPMGLDKPPSSMTLTQTPLSRCVWEGFYGRWGSYLSLGGPVWNSLTFVFDEHYYVFDSYESHVSFGFNNQTPGCGEPWNYGINGSAHAIPRAETTAPSLSKLCVLAGVPDDIDTKCDIMPTNKDTGYIRFFRPEFHTHVHMKYTLADIF